MKILLLLLTLLVGNISTAQSVKLISQFESKKHLGATLFISESGKKFFTKKTVIYSEKGEQIDLKTLFYAKMPVFKNVFIMHAFFGQEKIKVLVEVQKKSYDKNAIYMLELTNELQMTGTPTLLSEQTVDGKQFWRNEMYFSPDEHYAILFSNRYHLETTHYEFASISFDNKLNLIDSNRVHLDPGIKKYTHYDNAIITSKGHLVTNIEGVLHAFSDNSIIPLILDIKQQVIPEAIYEKSDNEWLIAGTYENGAEKGAASLMYDFNAESLIKEEYVPFPADFSEKPAVASPYKYTPRLMYSTRVGSDICFVYSNVCQIIGSGGSGSWDEIRNILVRRVTWDGEQVWESLQITAVPFMISSDGLQFKVSEKNLYVFSVDVKENYDAVGNYRPVEPKKHPLVTAANKAIYMKFSLSTGNSQRKMILYKELLQSACKYEYNNLYLKFLQLDALAEDTFIFYIFGKNSCIAEIAF